MPTSPAPMAIRPAGAEAGREQADGEPAAQPQHGRARRQQQCHRSGVEHGRHHRPAPVDEAGEVAGHEQPLHQPEVLHGERTVEAELGAHGGQRVGAGAAAGQARRRVGAGGREEDQEHEHADAEQHRHRLDHAAERAHRVRNTNRRAGSAAAPSPLRRGRARPPPPAANRSNPAPPRSRCPNWRPAAAPRCRARTATPRSGGRTPSPWVRTAALWPTHAARCGATRHGATSHRARPQPARTPPP